MLIFLYGPDTYRSKQKLKEIVEQYKKVHKSGLNLKYLEGNNLKFEDFALGSQQSSMFKEKKLLMVKNVFSNQSFKESFLKNFKKAFNSQDIILFQEEGAPSKKDKFFNFLKKEAKCQEFGFLEGKKLENWIKREVKKQGAEIKPEALSLLIEFCQSDLWRQAEEINKLANFKKGTIERKDVELLVKPEIETDIFKTIDAIAQKNKKKALLLLGKHLQKGEHPLYLLTMINFQFRNLLTVKDLAEKGRPYYVILKSCQLHPFVVKKSWAQAKNFTLPELKKTYQRIFKADLDIKTGKLQPDTALELLVTEI